MRRYLGEVFRRLAQQIREKRVLRLIRADLRAGILENGLVKVPSEGTPQGGPLSPFESNVVLDEWDKELEGRGHRFVRYGDDGNMYVKSRRAGERVMASLRRFITDRLKLKVNATKSAVDVPQPRKFLGFTLTAGRSPNRRKIAPEWLRRLNAYLLGWRSYFGICETGSVLRDLDSWICHRLRCVQWKQSRVYGRRKAELVRLGVVPELAHSTA